MKNFPLSAPTGPGRRSLDVPRPSGGGGGRSIPRRLLLFTCILALASCQAAAAEDTLLGVGYRSVLVSFDPHAGVTLEQHLQLNPHEIFGWLAYDPNHHRLYALARNTENLYWIDTETLQITHVGNLHVESTIPGQVAIATALAYDPSTDTLYTTVAHYETLNFGNLWSELCSVDPATGALPACLARINGPMIDALAFGLADGQLHGLALFDPLNKESRVHVVQINTGSGQMESLFQTPYHTVMGLAAGGPHAFYTWINWTSHVYGLIDVLSETVTLLATSDGVGVISAMERKDFPLASAPLVPDPAPASFVFGGHVTAVWDPEGHLGKAIAKGHSFTGTFSYDTTAPYRLVDPNLYPPYGMTVRVNKQAYFFPSLRVTVTNNLYYSANQPEYDKFFLVASDPRQYTGSWIGWNMSDPTATALSTNGLLPAEFDLSQWQTNTFVISGGGPYWDEPTYTITGTVDHISNGEAFDAMQNRHRHAGE